jgi:PPOX class probable F420-dependent enzyme
MSWTMEQMKEFVGAGVIGRLATASPIGEPHVVPLWYQMNRDRILAFSLRSHTKARHIAANPRFALTVDDDSPPYRGVTVIGSAELAGPPDADPAELIRTLAIRHLGLEAGTEVGNRLAANAEATILLLRPERWLSWDYSQ